MLEKGLPNFTSVIDDIHSAAITDLACEDQGIVQLIHSMWTARFE